MKNNMRKPPIRSHGPNFEKAKDFKGALKRLLKELKGFNVLIIVSLVLACAGAILSISAPDKLSNMTDKISEGLIINQDNLKSLSNEIASSVNEENISKIMKDILNLNLTNENIYNIMSSNEISDEDKKIFQNIISSSDIKNNISNIPESILLYLIDDSTYNGVYISKEDKIALLKTDFNSKNINIPESIQNILFKDIKIDNTIISVDDQIKFVSKFQNINSNNVYSKLDEMPKSIRTIVEPKMDINAIKKIALTLIIIYLLSALFTFIQSLSMTTVANKFAKKLRSSISSKINKLPLKYFDLHKSGDVLSRVTNDIDTIAQSMNQSLATLVSSITLFLGSIIMMFYTNYIMAFTAIISSLFGFIFMMKILSKSQKYFIARQVELGNLNGHIEEVYSGLNVVKAYNGKKISDEKFDEYNKKVYEANRKSNFLSGLMMPFMNFVGNFGYVCVCIVGALLTKNNIITFGVIVAFITYVRLFTSPLSQIAQSMTNMQSTLAASERVFEFLDEKQMDNQDNITKKLDRNMVKGNIEFDNVSFTYDGNEKPTIKNFSAKIKSGNKVAIVGPTGAGKTTMVNLLMKFYDITSGDIKIDGISIKDLTRENIHDLFTMVLQDTWIFDGTVKENIIYNRKNSSLKDAEKICKTVGLHHFIKTLPKGYDSKLSDNDSISSGQRQLLTIARAMMDDAPFLILDEATSNVDTRTEELVQNAMDKLTQDKTSFIIAHRLSTIKNADLILVMKDGNIIEQGNHEELMKKNGFYAELYNSQFEL